MLIGIRKEAVAAEGTAHRSLRGSIALALALNFGAAGCSSFRTFQIESRPPEDQVIVDGQAADWAGKLFYVEGQKVSLGFLNDRDCLYICLRTDAASMRRQILRSGLTVWVDPKGGRKKVFGIKYPVGLSPDEQHAWRGEERADPGAPAEPGGNLSELEIFRQGRPEPESLDIADAPGIELKVSTAGKNLVYELKLPLAPAGQNSLGVGAPPGAMVGIGFETGKMDLNDLPRRPGGLVGGTGGLPPMGGYGGRGGMMRPGRMRPNDPEIPENLKVWAVVRLSAGTDPLPAQVQSFSE